MAIILEHIVVEEDERISLPEGVPPLHTFYLYLTEGCNLRCRHCWVAPVHEGATPAPGTYLTVDLLQRAVQEAKPLGLTSAKLTGGEPLLNPEFRGIVDYLTEEELSLSMETNATLLDAQLARHLKEQTSLRFISVSLDGPNAEIHDAFRGVPGSFSAAVTGLRHLVEAGYHPQVIMSLHRGNVVFLEEVVELAIALGAGSVKFNPVTSSGRGAAMQQHGETLPATEVLRLAHYVRGELQARSDITLYVGTPPAFYSVEEIVERGNQGQCSIYNILGILGSGEMALCGIGRTIPELAYGNLREHRVSEVWLHHPMLQKLRQELAQEYPGVCGRCIHTHRCLTWCPADNYQRTGQLVAPAWLCEEADRLGLFPTSRLR